MALYLADKLMQDRANYTAYCSSWYAVSIAVKRGSEPPRLNLRQPKSPNTTYLGEFGAWKVMLSNGRRSWYGHQSWHHQEDRFPAAQMIKLVE